MTKQYIQYTSEQIIDCSAFSTIEPVTVLSGWHTETCSLSGELVDSLSVADVINVAANIYAKFRIFYISPGRGRSGSGRCFPCRFPTHGGPRRIGNEDVSHVSNSSHVSWATQVLLNSYKRLLIVGDDILTI